MDRTTDKYVINARPQDLVSFEVFKARHKLAWDTDKLTAEERWVKLGKKLPGKDKKE